MIFLGSQAVHPHCVPGADFPLLRGVGVAEVGGCGFGHALLLAPESSLGLVLFVCDDAVDEEGDAVLALEFAPLNAVEALGIGLVSEHSIFKRRHFFHKYSIIVSL